MLDQRILRKDTIFQMLSNSLLAYLVAVEVSMALQNRFAQLVVYASL